LPLSCFLVFRTPPRAWQGRRLHFFCLFAEREEVRHSEGSRRRGEDDEAQRG